VVSSSGGVNVLGKVGQSRRAGIVGGMGQQRLRLKAFVSEMDAIAVSGRG
jgi:hypothetical protein